MGGKGGKEERKEDGRDGGKEEGRQTEKEREGDKCGKARWIESVFVCERERETEIKRKRL